MKSQNVIPDIKAFCALHEMHTQFRNKMVDGKKVIKYFGCSGFKPARTAKLIAPASKTKWNEDWYRYWFYHSVPLVEERDESRKMVKRHPLAAKMSKNDFECRPVFASTKNSKICGKAYKLCACLQGARDLCEEYIAARVWSLRKSWCFVHFHKKTVRGIFPNKEDVRPVKFDFNEEFVAAVEKKEVAVPRKFLKKETDLLDKLKGKDY